MTRAEYNDNIQYWSGNVLRFAVWNCGDRMRGEDAMQEAFARLWEIKEQVSVEKGLGFLLTVARRYLVDCFRHDAVVAKAHAEMAQTAETTTEQKGYGLSDEMLEALNSLPEVQRSIIQLRDVDGYSYKEIAQMLDLSDQQVQVYLFRARTNMKKYLTKK
ncbi:MAG: sigma-70 family RNA polymerase sigma factor [Bacteroidales bacterium]|jgi:RNA polymerase sigma-70 factor (ECF subfamily)|nr:sigma-70 family RNA polymerase sigma factor [Bacteroidales bacterium]MBR4176116.1 sigma-70 family RNA polymerase sigma factor [Bacteroidales bacterium]MBR4715852.1 sigma-70 family RNA polymerase sigma factor [Bacteroidales bacterium]